VQKPHNLLCLLILGVFSNTASGALLDFNDRNNLGVTLGGKMTWNGTGNGHLFNDDSNFDDYIFFSAATYVNSFEMNAMAWQDFGRGNVGLIDVAGLNAANETVWSTSVDLTDYTDWSNWLTVDVETADITQLTFFAPGVLPNFNSFWPSVDNIIINEQMPQVPVPAAIWLFGTGLISLFGFSRSRRTSKQAIT